MNEAQRKVLVRALYAVSILCVVWGLFLMGEYDYNEAIWPGAGAIVAFVGARYLVAGSRKT